MEEYDGFIPDLQIAYRGMNAWHNEVTSVIWSDLENKAIICKEVFKLNPQDIKVEDTGGMIDKEKEDY